MTMRLYNTLSGTKELLQPITPGRIGLYLCGPTVYKPSHLGHAVGPIIFDVLKRYLSYKGFTVRWVLNVTDVDDKLIVEAAAQKTTVPELAKRIEDSYTSSMRRLGITAMDDMPRASEHIPEIIASIQGLIARGFAYAGEGNVYFEVGKDSHYGKLSNRKTEEQEESTRANLVEAGKRNKGDFALWKAAKPGEPAEVVYDSPWGPGRPGWHIECSAMSSKYLGETFDIHGGGMDLIFPHHENEIAQSECLTGKPFAKIWMHHGLTRFNTKKISKSDASMTDDMARLTLTHLLEELGPELIRFVIISSHYRSPLDFSEETVAAARKGMQTFYRLFERAERTTGRSAYQSAVRIENERERAKSQTAREFVQDVLNKQLEFLRLMDDDLNTAAAIGVLFELATSINRFADAARLESGDHEDDRAVAMGGVGTLLLLGRILGLFEQPPAARTATDDGAVGKLVEILIETRHRAKAARQFELCDYIRAQLKELKIVLEDRGDKTTWRRE